MEYLRNRRAFISDMDGVIYHGNRLLPGAREFVDWLIRNKKNFLFLTNSSERTPRELHEKLKRLGVDVDESHFYTSALATASFLKRQCPGGSVFVIGEAGIINALYEAGFTMNDTNPDYVVVGDTQSYSFEKIQKAVRMIESGARLIGTNPDLTSPAENGIIPATGALMAPIELTANVNGYCIGKPNPLMMRNALKRLGCGPEDGVIVGDRMDTDIIAGVESQITTVLVLSGVTKKEDLKRYAYSPDYVLDGVGDIPG